MIEQELLDKFSLELDRKIEAINQTSKTEIQKTVREEFKNALMLLGIDAANPMMVQRDMQFVRDHRLEAEDTKKQIKSKVVNHVVTFFVCLLGLGFYEFLTHKITTG